MTGDLITTGSGRATVIGGDTTDGVGVGAGDLAAAGLGGGEDSG